MSMTIEECSATRQPRPVPQTSRNVLEQLSMKGKLTVVTGAADGIGLAAVEAVIEAGGDAAMVYRSNDSAVEKAKKLAEQYGVKVRAYKCDGELKRTAEESHMT